MALWKCRFYCLRLASQGNVLIAKDYWGLRGRATGIRMGCIRQSPLSLGNAVEMYVVNPFLATLLSIVLVVQGKSLGSKLRPLEEIQELLSREKRDLDVFERSDRVYAYMRQVLPLLQLYVGRWGPTIDIRHFENYDRTINISNVFYVKPTHVSHVQCVIQAAHWLGLRVRAVGYFQSRAPLFVDEGHVMLDITGLERHDGPKLQINEPTATRAYHTVTSLSGVVTSDLNAFLVRHRLTFLSQPIEVNGTVGGMVAASSHGSSWDGPTMSGYVVEMRIIDSRARLRTFTMEDDGDVMKALMCSLGVFGIMYDVTLKVFPMKIAKVENQFLTIEDLFYNAGALKAVVTSKFLTEPAWYPFSGITDSEAEEYARTGTIPSNWSAKKDVMWLRTIELVEDVDPSLIQGPVFLPTQGALSGGNVTGLLRGRAGVAIPRSLPRVSYHYLIDAFATILPPKHGRETSAAFMMNIDKDFDRPTRAVQFIIEESERQIRLNGTTPINALLPRFVLNVDCLLCPANTAFNVAGDTGRSFVIDFLAPPWQPGFYDITIKFMAAFENEDIRPHWPKRYDNIPGIIRHIRRVYGDNIRTFMAARGKADVDPCDMFMNSYLSAILGHTQKFC
ncbi:uncharacterized protein [Haliotis asinina]|uniref:uncharacterized protein isoform X1 n=2 Tax=Haliotis asinina TaxID=109174 RepID=UPI003531B760